MIKVLIISIVLSVFSLGFTKISEINRIKEEAEIAFKKNQFREASALYERLINDFQLSDENIQINLAHSYFKIQERAKAEKIYQDLTSSPSNEIRSVSFQQLGVLRAMRGKNQQAIQFLIKCLKIDPNNEVARYNYELLKKIEEIQLEEDKSSKAKRANQKNKGNEKGGNKPGDKQKEKDLKIVDREGSNNAQKGPQQKGGDFREEAEEGRKKNSREFDPEGEDSPDQKNDEEGDKNKEGLRTRRLAQMNLTEDRAKMILDAMKNEELQYLQQLKKNQVNKKYKNKPDW